jgi:hypothetical protein
MARKQIVFSQVHHTQILDTAVFGLGNELRNENEIASHKSRNSSAEGCLAWQDGLLPQVLNHQVIQRLQNVLSVGAHP